MASFNMYDSTPECSGTRSDDLDFCTKQLKELEKTIQQQKSLKEEIYKMRNTCTALELDLMTMESPETELARQKCKAEAEKCKNTINAANPVIPEAMDVADDNSK